MRADAGQVCQDHISMFDYGFNNFQKVEVPGGAVTIPKDVQVSDLTNTDNSYYYGTDYYVGSGSEEVQAEEPSVIAAEETTPTPEVTPESADSNTGQDEKTQTVYRYVIYILAGLIAVTLVVTIVSGIRKHMKRKNEEEILMDFSLLFSLICLSTRNPCTGTIYIIRTDTGVGCHSAGAGQVVPGVAKFQPSGNHPAGLIKVIPLSVNVFPAIR